MADIVLNLNNRAPIVLDAQNPAPVILESSTIITGASESFVTQAIDNHRVDPEAHPVSVTATTPIGGHRAVAWQPGGSIGYPDLTNPVDAHAAIGVTINAAATGATVLIVTEGLITETSWAWTPLAVVYIGVNGVLTQTPPIAPSWVRIIGIAVTATKLWVHPEAPIIQI